MNLVFFLLTFAAVALAGWTEAMHGPGAMAALAEAALKAAEGAVPLALGLVGILSLFLGLMKVAEAGGLVRAVARLLAPALARLFPEVPAGHPALGAMVMNVAANILGLGNPATPFGIRAMEHLDRLNPAKGTATNAQVLFLAINTAGITILPTSVIALRATLGAAEPAAVVAPTLAATLVSTIVAVIAARLLQRLSPAPAALAEPDGAGMVCKNSGTPGVDNEGSTPLLQVPTGVMLCGGPDTSANAPYCENVTLFAAVSGAKEMGPFCASTVEIAYRFAAPEVLDTIKIFRPSGENAAAVAFGICSTVVEPLDWLKMNTRLGVVVDGTSLPETTTRVPSRDTASTVPFAAEIT